MASPTIQKQKSTKNQMVYVWEFRANADDWSWRELSTLCHKIGKKWVFQLEQGEKSGYKHWQGRVSLFKKKRKSELMAQLQGLGAPVPQYLQPTTTEEHLKAAFYCMKDDTRLEGPYKNTDVPAYVPRQYRNMKLRPWQQDLIDSKDVFDDRKVDCIIDPIGNQGKSTVASIADLHHKCIDMPTTNDGEKLIQSLCDILIAKDCRVPGICLFDMPRAQSKDKLGGLYAGIEQIKKGKVWDSRHQYKEWWFDSPRIWVFTNEPPNTGLLSRDRWRFWKIEKQQLLLENLYESAPA